MFQVKDYYALLALNRVFMRCKFHEPVDPTLVSSPFVAEMARQVVEALAAIERQNGNTASADKWEQATIVDNTPMWRVVINIAASIEKWDGWDNAQKGDVLRLIASPFDLTDIQITKLIAEVDEHKRQKSGMLQKALLERLQKPTEFFDITDWVETIKLIYTALHMAVCDEATSATITVKSVKWISKNGDDKKFPDISGVPEPPFTELFEQISAKDPLVSGHFRVVEKIKDRLVIEILYAPNQL